MKEIIKPTSYLDLSEVLREQFNYHNEVLINNEAEVDVLFIGDSIVQFWPLEAYFNDGLYVNRGIACDVLLGVLHRFMADAVQLKPKLTIISVGVNDTAILNNYQDMLEEFMDIHLKHMLNLYKQLIDISKENNMKVAFTSIVPTRIEPYRRVMIKRVNDGLKDLTEREGVDYIDYYSHMVDSDELTLKPNLDHDTIHPHVYGYNIMAKVMREYLDKVKGEFNK